MNDTPAPASSRTLWLRRMLWAAFGIFVCFFLATAGLAYFVLDSESGTQWSLQAMQRLLPQLSIVDAQGSWQRGLQARAIAWRDTDIDIEIDRVDIALRWQSLLYGEIKLPRLHARALRIAPKGPSTDDSLVLPTLFLPMVLAISDLSVAQLDIVDDDSTFSLHGVRGGVHWQGTTLRLTDAHVGWDNIDVTASGKLSFRGDYPLLLNGQLKVPQWPEAIDIKTQGDLRKLRLTASTREPLAVLANIDLAALDKDLPLQLSARLQQPFTHTIDGDRVEIAQATLDARGNLTRLDGTLALAPNDSRYGPSKLTGDFSWEPGGAQTQLQWQLGGGTLQLQCNADLNSPISAVCAGDANSIPLTPWLGGATAAVSTAIKLDVTQSDSTWVLALALPNLRGQLNNDAITANIAVRSESMDIWQLQPSFIRIGPNEIKGSGELGTRNRLQLAINARDLAHLHASAAGSMSGSIILDGNPAMPTIRAQLSASRLRFGDVSATRTRLDVVLPKLGNESGRVHIDAHGMTVSNSPTIDFTFTANGDRGQQDWALTAQRQTNYARLHCRTQTDAGFDKWQLDCRDFSGRIRSGETAQSWRNTAALRGRGQHSIKQFELAPFCLAGDDLELCLEQALRYADAKIAPVSAHIRGIPLRWASPWLPDDFNLIGDPRLAAQAQLNSVSPLDIKASAQIPSTHWRWHTATASESAEINAIRIDAALDEKRALLTTSAQSPTLGRVDVNLTIVDPRVQRTLSGHVDIGGLQLAGFAWAFQGLDSISGEINGAIDITGTAAAPQLHGQLLLKDGAALWAPLGAPFRTVHADLTFNNTSAKLGGWFALGQGGGDIDGDIVWENGADQWKLRLGVVAGGVSAMPLPNSTVVFSPHAQLTAQPGEMHIDGYVDIASAEIQLKELPPQTTDVSQDQEIVGHIVEDDASKLWIKLGLNLGEQFHLSGFGADVNLSGRLQLDKSPGDNMHLYGEVKVPRGRYRAYGQRLTVRRGSVIFYGPLENPDLNLEAVRDLPPGVTDVVGMRVIGSLKTPEAILFSEPSMPDSDIAYYLLTGRKPVAGTTGTSGYSASGALLSLGLAGSESKAGQLAQRFGITDLQLGTSETRNGESEAEVSGQLGKDLFVRYGRGLGQQSNSISFQYRLTPKLMIETISGVDEALDLLYSFEIK